MKVVNCTGWSKMRTKLVHIHKAMLTGGVLFNLGKDELTYFVKESNRVIMSIENEFTSAKMSE